GASALDDVAETRDLARDARVARDVDVTQARDLGVERRRRVHVDVARARDLGLGAREHELRRADGAGSADLQPALIRGALAAHIAGTADLDLDARGVDTRRAHVPGARDRDLDLIGIREVGGDIPRTLQVELVEGSHRERVADLAGGPAGAADSEHERAVLLVDGETVAHRLRRPHGQARLVAELDGDVAGGLQAHGVHGIRHLVLGLDAGAGCDARQPHAAREREARDGDRGDADERAAAAAGCGVGAAGVLVGARGGGRVLGGGVHGGLLSFLLEPRRWRRRATCGRPPARLGLTPASDVGSSTRERMGAWRSCRAHDCRTGGAPGGAPTATPRASSSWSTGRRRATWISTTPHTSSMSTSRAWGTSATGCAIRVSRSRPFISGRVP